MAQKKTYRLHFAEEDLSDKKVKTAVSKAETAADKADRAKERLPVKRKLRWEREDMDGSINHTRETSKKGASDFTAKKKIRQKQVYSEAAQNKKSNLKLKFDEVDAKKPSGSLRKLTHTPMNALSGKAHQAINQGNEDDNVGVKAAHFTESTGEGAAHAADHALYSHKLRQFQNAEKLEGRADAANVEALYQKALADNPEAASNPISRWQQKQAIKKEYAAMKSGQRTAQAGSAGSKTANGAKKAGEEAEKITEKIIEFIKAHSHIILIILAAAMLLILISGLVSSCSVMIGGSGNTIVGTSYTAEEEDIIGADEDYTALENALQGEIDNIESTHSGYDEYRYNLAQIGHNPYELAALLTVQYEDYTRSEVQDELQRIFDMQYELILEEEVEIRTRTETHTSTSTDPETGETTEEEYEVEVEYEYYILNVTLINSSIGSVESNLGLTDDQLERYNVLLGTSGNRGELFADVSFAAPGEFTDYDIPGEALTDERFRRMITEAEKYLGYPYVWGGSSPGTSFDCSGFVSWVINHCSNGWNVGRQTANGLKGMCAIIPASQARPGDLIFFQGTYDTSGASHVGIYVGDGMMIHCGNPISYASIETAYWQQHFYCFGRLP